MKTSRILIILISAILGLGILGYLSIKFLLPGYTISSWWRTPLHNEEVGGVSNSMHLLGLGYDVTPKPSNTELLKFWWFRTKLTAYPNHVHLGFVG